MASREGALPETWPTEREATVDDFSVHPETLAGEETAEETVEAHYAALEGFESPHGCIDSWVYLGFEGEDENGEHVELIERVPCKRCHS